ncbi:MAG: helix-turn-helix transcriptional regulator [Hyphomicrobiaceae bacterium]
MHSPPSQAALRSEALSALLDQAYDCVLEPANWQRLLASLCERLDLLHGVLGYYEPLSGKPLLRIQHGMSPIWYDKMPAYGLDMANFWGGPERILSYPVGELVVHSVANPGLDAHSNRFAREWCAPQGIVDLAAMTLAGDSRGLGTLVFTSAHRLDQANVDELELLRALAPHLRRVISISRLLELRTIEAESLRSALEVLPTGIFLVDGAARIIHANDAAHRALQENDAIRISDGRLSMRDHRLAQALTDAISNEDRGAISERGCGIPARGTNGRRAVVHVLPLRYGRLPDGVEGRATAAVFVTSEHAHAPLPRDTLRLLYDLTPAEVRVCELIVAGMSPAAIAEHIGVAPSTARSHLQRIFEKTGTHRQADIVRLVASLSLIR